MIFTVPFFLPAPLLLGRETHLTSDYGTILKKRSDVIFVTGVFVLSAKPDAAAALTSPDAKAMEMVQLYSAAAWSAAAWRAALRACGSTLDRGSGLRARAVACTGSLCVRRRPMVAARTTSGPKQAATATHANSTCSSACARDQSMVSCMLKRCTATCVLNASCSVTWLLLRNLTPRSLRAPFTCCCSLLASYESFAAGCALAFTCRKSNWWDSRGLV